MRTKLATFLLVSLALVAGVFAAEHKKGAQAPKQIMLTPDDLQWKQGPAAVPTSQTAVLEGNPDKAGFFVMRVKLPAGAKIPPHYHDNVERVTVLSGAIKFAKGTTQDNPKVLPAGSYFAISPKNIHNVWVDEDTIIQIATRGPWTLRTVKTTEKKGEAEGKY